MPDMHSARRTEFAAPRDGGSLGLRIALVRMQDSKDDVRFSLHVNPGVSYSAGVQPGGYLSGSGFQITRGRCPFLERDGCYVAPVPEGFDIEAFAGSVENGFTALQESERRLDKCGFFLGREGRSSHRDGHTAATVKPLKASEDSAFDYRLTWLEDAQSTGWTTHLGVMHPPLSPEIDRALKFFDLKRDSECPEFDFEPCHWRFEDYERSGDRVFDRNTEMVYSWFDALPTEFSEGLRLLMEAHARMEDFGFALLPAGAPPQSGRLPVAGRSPSGTRARNAPSPALPDHFEVALSFAGSDRHLADELAQHLASHSVEVFYDNFFPEQLWGKDLVAFFDDVYRKRSKYCVMFVSAAYAEREWTNLERRSAQARALSEKGNDYILPIRVDDTDLPGLPPTVGYLSLATYSVEDIAGMLLHRLGRA